MSQELIVYACPTGPLADQLASYFAATRNQVGSNTAHRYPPHITLTGFFHDEASAIPRYLDALEHVLGKFSASRPEPPFQITEFLIGNEFHGLLIESPWAEALTADFKACAHSSTRTDEIRLKRNLHLSLAYGFSPEQHLALASLAAEHIDIEVPVSWELRFYERAGEQWVCHGAWPM
jgi:ubiquitin-associated SH3 domain-containing protein